MSQAINLKSMKRNLISFAIISMSIMACSNGNDESDAFGNFEVDEVLISAQAPGELIEFKLDEGQKLEEDEAIGMIDTTEFYLLKQEILANIGVINSQYQNIAAQINVLIAEKKNAEREIERSKKLLKSNAATQKQVDDLEGRLNVVEQQIEAIKAQNPAVFSQLEVSKAKLGQIDEKIRKSHIKAPFEGIVLNKIANEHQLVSPGSPLFTMANMSQMTFRSFISGSQLYMAGLGQEVEVLVDHHSEELKSYKGIISWVSDEAEFTPKIIQTREERVDMVYAVKILVENDGALKIGMPGEIRFLNAED